MFKIWPASLRAPADRRALLKQTPEGWLQVLIEIGTVTSSRACREHTRQFVLPAKAGY